MSKQQVVAMKDEAVQTEMLNTTTSSNKSYHSSLKSDEFLEEKKVIQTDNAHDKAYEYLELLRKEYSNELDNMYEKTGVLIEQVREAPSFSIGLKNAIGQYKTIKDEDKGNFILIQFLEEFYERYALFDNYYTPERHESNFKEALSLAYNAIDDHTLLGNIYDLLDNQ